MIYRERELTLFVPFTITTSSAVIGNKNEVTALHLASYDINEVKFLQTPSNPSKGHFKIDFASQ